MSAKDFAIAAALAANVRSSSVMSTLIVPRFCTMSDIIPATALTVALRFAGALMLPAFATALHVWKMAPKLSATPAITLNAPMASARSLSVGKFSGDTSQPARSANCFTTCL